MKALDTPILLGILEGEPSCRALLKRLRGIEVATTEANLLELGYIAAQGSPRSQAARRASLERLRRKLTVLPIDSRAVELATAHVARSGTRPPPLVTAMLGALEAAGCDELFTRERPETLGKWRLRVSNATRTNPKTR